MSDYGAAAFGRLEAKAFGEVLGGVLRRKRFYEKTKFGGLVDAWRDVVGEALAEQTSISSYAHGLLKVEVDSSVLLQELAGFLTPVLLQQMRSTKAGRDVAGIRFCLRTQDAARGEPNVQDDDGKA